jgi:predicted nucleotidyltransferase
MNPLVVENLEAIQAIARAFGVARLEVFGSTCTPAWDPVESDIDFLVTYPADYDFGP